MVDPTVISYVTRCPYCSQMTGVVNVHGHYQCEHCGKNINECCTGEQQNEIETLIKLTEIDSI